MATPTALSAQQIKQSLKSLNGWQVKGKEIVRTFGFKNFYETMAFVNAVAFIANQADHHPDLEVGYNKCVVRYSSHEAGGVTANDFSCAGKINSLVDKPIG
jgi:4a-hydroxytetrahydrobiopterin dehydratase